MADFTSISDSIYTPVPHAIPVTGGTAPDRPVDGLGDNFLASAKNFLVRDGRVRRREGYNTKIGATEPVGEGAQLFEWTLYNDSSFILLSSPSAFYYYDSTGDAWVDITTTAKTSSIQRAQSFHAMRTASSGLRLIGNNGDDPPYWWTGSTATSFTYMSTAVLGYAAAVWRSHFLLGDTTDTGDGKVSTRVHWSALGDPTVWSGTASAGSLDLIDNNATKILTIHPLRNQLFVYKEQSVHALTYKASPLYFTQQSIHPDMHILGRRAVVPILSGDVHFCCTKEGFIIWDGQTTKAVGRDRVDHTILTALNRSASNHIWCLWVPETQEVLVGIPTGSNTYANQLWIYNVLHDSWWETDLDFRHAIISYKVFAPPRIIGTRANTTKVFHLFNGVTDTTSSAAISSSIQTGLYAYDMVEHKGIFKLGVIAGPASASQATIAITKTSTENPLSAVSFASSQSLTLTGGNQIPRIDFRLTDRWIGYRITHSGAGETCEFRGLVSYVTPRSDARKRR